MATASRTRISLALLSALAVTSLGAQEAPRGEQPRIKPSQHGSVLQRIANTEITITYNRPVARGRELYGKLVPWGKIWCPGADEATSIKLSTDIQINGATLPAGSYSIWAEPNPTEWTIIFSKAHPVFHLPYPGAARDALRIQAIARSGQHMETMTYHFPIVDGKRAELVLHWGTVAVPMQIEVP
jgi:hypothetical protein